MISVVDNFLADPDAVREDALTFGVFDVTGNFPGRRTAPYALDLRHAFEALLGRPIECWPTGADSYNGAFQLVLREDGDSWIHHDATAYAAVLHLTPSYPDGHGTVFYRRRRSPEISRHHPHLPDWNELPSESTDWQETVRVEGVYNRLVFYDAMLYHRSGVPGFGDRPWNGRLTQVWFFDA